MKKYLEIYQKNWKNHGIIMKFCQARKVGTLNRRLPNSDLNAPAITDRASDKRDQKT